MQNKTVVVNLYHDAYDVYIGRAGKGQSGYYGNPFTKGTRKENIEAFQRYFYERLQNDPFFSCSVRSLRGKRLACFCKPNKACHGDIIVNYLNNLQPLIYAVIGSRSFDNYDFMQNILRWYDIKMIISGAAKGADSLARKYAHEHNIPIKEFFPNWDQYKKAAGFIRNKLIIDNCDEVITFWDGISQGTHSSIKLARQTHKPVYTYWPPQDEIAELGL